MDGDVPFLDSSSPRVVDMRLGSCYRKAISFAEIRRNETGREYSGTLEVALSGARCKAIRDREECLVYSVPFRRREQSG
jgi:hypothetical protein